jgi:hypothetical protein
MSTVHSPGKCVVIGDEYAKRLGYEELVGAMGIIDSVMSALCGVTVLAGNSEAIGKQVDIHIQDCIVSANEKEEVYAVVINISKGEILYSTNTDLVDYTRKCLYREEVREFRNIHNIHEIIDFCNEHMKKTYEKKQMRNRDFDWIPYCLDDRNCEVARPYLETYEAEMAANEVDKEAVSDLTASFLKQMQAHTDKKVQQIRDVNPYEPKELKPMSYHDSFDDDDEYVSYRDSDEDDDYYAR